MNPPKPCDLSATERVVAEVGTEVDIWSREGTYSVRLGGVASGGTGKVTGDTLLVSVDALAGEGSLYLSLEDPVSEKPRCGHGQQLGTELLLYSSGQELHAGLSRLPGPWAVSKKGSQPLCAVCLQNLWAWAWGG